MSDYTELDDAIVAAIGRGRRTFTEIWSACCDEAAAVAGNGGGYRATDRRLQSLRKRGLIAYAKGAWSLAKPAGANT